MFRLTLSVVFLLIASSVSSWGELPSTILPLDSPSVSSASQWDENSVFNLNSKPGATHTIYLDFNGNITTNTQWNLEYNSRQDIKTPPFSIDSDTKTFSQTDRNAIVKIWAQVAEDYAPFDVNVTTVEPPNDIMKQGMRVCIGDSSETWYGKTNVGGVAYPPDKFDTEAFNSRTPTFVFAKSLKGDTKQIAEVISHEVGHTLGIDYHYGLGTGLDNKVDAPNATYYFGDKEGKWAPIMGAGHRNEVTQWSKGDYPGATRGDGVDDERKEKEPYTPSPEGGDEIGDLEIISDKIGYSEDDHQGGNDIKDYQNDNDYVSGTMATIDELFDPFDREFIKTGIIEKNSDADVFQFTLNSGEDLTFSVLSGIWQVGEDMFSTAANLDVLMRLFLGDWTEIDLTGMEDLFSGMGVGEIRLSELAEQFEFDLAGTYYLWLEGTGRDGYYSDYGSLGTYAVQGRFQQAPLGSPPVPTMPQIPITPEPTTLIMFGLGLLGLASVRQRK